MTVRELIRKLEEGHYSLNAEVIIVSPRNDVPGYRISRVFEDGDDEAGAFPVIEFSVRQ